MQADDVEQHLVRVARSTNMGGALLSAGQSASIDRQQREEARRKVRPWIAEPAAGSSQPIARTPSSAGSRRAGRRCGSRARRRGRSRRP